MDELADEGKPQSLVSNQMLVASYNIWFDNIDIYERVLSLIVTINKKRPDIICLQEVRPDVFRILISNLTDHKYHYPKKIEDNYGCVTFSKYPITKCTVHNFSKTNMDRNLIITKILHPFKQTEILVVTTHFESVFEKCNPIKIKQLLECSTVLESFKKDYANIIFCVDTNILPNEESFLIDTGVGSGWIDCWKQKGSQKNKYTFNSYTNKWLVGNKKKYQSRLDRIIYNCENIELVDFLLLKSENDHIEPSDHYGILTKFNIKN